MNLLFTTLAYYPYVGGHAVVTRATVEELIQRGHKVSILTSNLVQFSPFKKVKTGLAQIDGIPVLRFNSMWPDMSHKKIFGNAFTALIDNLSKMDEKSSSLENVFFVMRALSFPFTPQMLLWSLTDDTPQDVIHALDLVWSTSFIGYMMAKRKKLPYVVTPLLHTYTSRHRGQSLFKVLRGANMIIAVTKSEQDFIIKRGVPPEKVHQIDIGIDTKRLEGGCGTRFRLKYGISADEPIVLFIGRKEVDKGVIQLLKAMNYVWYYMPNARLVIIGPNGILPTDVETYKDTLSSLSTSRRQKILDLGVAPDREKLDALSASDVFVMPSVRESFGIVYLEAWYFSKPVIGALCKPVSDVIENGVDGFLVRFGDTKDLADQILMLLKNEKLRKELGNRGHEKLISRYTSKLMVSKLEKAYEEL